MNAIRKIANLLSNIYHFLVSFLNYFIAIFQKSQFQVPFWEGDRRTPKVALLVAYEECFEAARNGNLVRLEALLKDHPMLLNAKDDRDTQGFYPVKGSTALLYTAAAGSTECVNMLIKAGAKVDIQSNDGKTALYAAAATGNVECLRLMLEAGAKVDTQDTFGGTALISACISGREDCATLLLHASANVNLQDIVGNSALIWAALTGQDNCVKLLLRAGANLELRSTYAGSAMTMVGAVAGHEESVLRIRQASVQDKIQNNGKTALTVAKEQAHAGTASILAEAKGKHEEAVLLSNGCFFPLWGCRKDAFQRLTRLIKHEEALRLGFLVPMTDCHRNKMIFISQRWLHGNARIPHPDNEENLKLKAIQVALSQDELLDIELVWIDYLCVPQDNEETQLFAINSLPFYVRQCSAFMVLIGEAGIINMTVGLDEASWEVYQSRGWCRLECFAAASLLLTRHVQVSSKSLPANFLKCNINTGAIEEIPVSALVALERNPFDGAFHDNEKETLRIAPMVSKLCKFLKDCDQVNLYLKEFVDIMEKDAEERLPTNIIKKSVLQKL